MIKYIPLAALLFAAPALAQQAPAQPSPQAIIVALHSQLQQETDALTLSEAREAEDQQTIAGLQAQLATAKTAPKVKAK